jgi:uncharacterized protein involved in exopolysaccharide biosynthesis
LGPVAAGAFAVGLSFLVAPTFTATTTFLPPQQSQSSMSTALASLGAVAGLTGAGAGVRGSGDQIVGLLQSNLIADRIIDQFELINVYGSRYRADARRELARNVRMAYGKKDGIITVEVDDKEPARAANIANQYTTELHRLSATLAISEAQQRRVFFEQHLSQSRDRLAKAQSDLLAVGFNAGTLKAEPKAAVDSYARLKAEVSTAEMRLQSLRQSLADAAPEIRQQQSIVDSLRGQLSHIERTVEVGQGPAYIDRYREYKYQEALFELYARQFELARVDESREGALVQVVDRATPPEKKSKPQRGLIGMGCAAVVFALLILWVASARPRRAKPTVAA